MRGDSRRAVVRVVWMWWSVLLAVPVVVLALGALLPGAFVAVRWSVASMLLASLATLWLVTAAPAAFVLRSHCFRAVWGGRAVAVRSYVRGVVTVWGALEVAALLGVFGAVVTQSWLPCLLPAALALVALALLRPSERAMAL